MHLIIVLVNYLVPIIEDGMCQGEVWALQLDFMGLYGMVFLKEISIWLGRLSKTDNPPQCNGHHPIHWETKQNEMAQKD